MTYPLMPQFLSNRCEGVLAIRHAIDRGDYEVVRLLAHRMKGNGEAMGSPRSAMIGGALEQAAQERDVLTIQRSMSELEDFPANIEVDVGEASWPDF